MMSWEFFWFMVPRMAVAFLFGWIAFKVAFSEEK